MTVTTPTLGGMLRQQAALRGDATALVDGDVSVSYRQLDADADRVAAGLQHHGIAPGARVAVLAQDSARLFAVLLGIVRAGAVALPINWRLQTGEIRFILEHAQAAALFVQPDLLPRVGDLAGLPGLAQVVTLGAGAAAAGSPTDLDRWLAGAAAAPAAVAASGDDVAVQMYTSGTTGRPKGVMLAHRSFFAVLQSLRAAGDPWLGWCADDVVLLAIPSFHIGGLWWAMTGLLAGARNVVLPAFAGWRVLAAIARHRVTKVCLVPAMIQVCLSEPGRDRVDLSSLRCLVYGGSPIPAANLEQAMAAFGCDFAQIYGLTETGNTAVCLRPEDHRRRELWQAAGRPYPGVRLQVIDPDGRPLPPGGVGEVCVHSPANMVGYWRDPAATDAVLRDGWLHTGDAGFVDEQGYLHICDRIKDMIISAGENVYPAEVEAALASHPAVAEVGVIGVPDDRWGELVKAIVVLRPDARAGAAELIAHARRQLADFKVPRSVDFAASLPRTPSGKIQKHVLSAPFWAGRSRRVN